MIALVAGAGIAVSLRRWTAWPLATVLVLWPSFGGHWVEVCFLNWVRPRLSPSIGLQSAARVLVWFVGGSLLVLGMRLTASAFVQWPWLQALSWWHGGAAFVLVELAMHLFMQL